MSWAQSKSTVVRAALAGATLTGLIGVGAALAEPAIIVKSTSNTYPVGTKVDDEATITLEDGDRVSVLTQKGSRTMKGPGTFVVGANPKSNRNRFTNLKRRGAAKRSNTGGVRGVGAAIANRPSSPKVFYVDVARSGRVCLTNTQDVALWRPYADNAAAYIVNGTGLTAPVPVTFDKDVSVAPPAGAPLALSGGATYTIMGGEAGEGAAMTIATVTVVDLGREYERADELAQALFDNGCMAQFEVMGERLLPGA